MKRYTFFLLYSIFLFLFSISLTAQKEALFELSTQDLASFSSNEQETIDRLIGAGKTDRIIEGWVINFREIEGKKDLSLSIRLPGINRDLQVVSENMGNVDQTLFGKTEYVLWSGKIYGPKKYGNFLYLKGDDGSYGGMFQFNGKTFEVLPISSQNGVLREVNPAWAKDVICGTGLGEEIGGNEENITSSTTPVPCQTPPSSCLYPWKILVAYPQPLLDYIVLEANYDPLLIGFMIALPKATFTTTLSNSGISAPRLSFVDVNIGTQFMPTGNINTDLSNFSSIEGALYPTHQHDRAVLMTLQEYFVGGGQIYGQAACNPYHTATGYNSSCTNAIVSWLHIWIPQYTFAHELGHLFGGRHEITVIEGDPTSCAHGNIFSPNGGEDRTIMATYNTNAQPNSVGILYFSDPNNTYNGYTIGASNENNTIMVQNIICENTSFVGNPNEETAFRQTFDPGNRRNEILVYPNPASATIYISAREEFEAIEILSSDGKYVESLGLTTLGKQQKLTIRNLAPGLYFLRLKSSTSFEMIKFLKL